MSHNSRSIRLRNRNYRRGKRRFLTNTQQKKIRSSRILHQKDIANRESSHKAVPPNSSNKYGLSTKTFFYGISMVIALQHAIVTSNPFAQHMTLFFAVGLADFTPQVKNFLSQWFSPPKN